MQCKCNTIQPKNNTIRYSTMQCNITQPQRNAMKCFTIQCIATSCNTISSLLEYIYLAMHHASPTKSNLNTETGITHQLLFLEPMYSCTLPPTNEKRFYLCRGEGAATRKLLFLTSQFVKQRTIR